MAGQLAILGVTVATCVGTTFGLNYLSHTYVAKIFRPPAGAASPTAYPCERLSILGNFVKDEFDVKDISKTTAFQHPFCNFQFGGRYFYVATPQITDEKVREEFDRKLA